MYCKNCGNLIKSGANFCNICGYKVQMKRGLKVWIKNHKRGIIISLVIIFVLFLIRVSDNFTSNQTDVVAPTQISKPLQNLEGLQNQIISSVVEIICDNGKAGSGTILLDNGSIVTNNHVITGSKNCVATLPDPKTGVPAAIYNATPYSYPGLSEQYDIAILTIYSTYTDTDGKTWGIYPTKFPTYKRPVQCDNYTPQLGDSVRIYGYPATSHNYNLTITDGVISNFADDGTILTSANIDSGNSGGLAVSQNGCMLGIPSAVLFGNYQNLGVIIPNNIILEFFNKASATNSK
jgi:S1-C subfamily serine protease